MTGEQLTASVSEFSLEFNGITMPVIRFGCGSRDLVIIAGMSLCGLAGQGQAVAAAYAAFAEQYTVYLFDRREQLPQGFRVEDMAEDVYTALQQLGVTQADVYGVSQGGMIGLCLAIHHPQLVHRLALCSSTARADEVMKATMAKWTVLGRGRDVVAINRCFFEKVYSPAFLNSVRELLPALEKQGTPENCVRFEILAQACAAFDVYDQLPAITCPVLVINDLNDRVLDSRCTIAMAQEMGYEVEVFNDYSHAVFDEAPEVKERLMDFLMKDNIA